MTSGRWRFTQSVEINFENQYDYLECPLVSVHYKPTDNIGLEEAKARLRGYLKSGVEGHFSGMCKVDSVKTDYESVYYFKDGYVVCPHRFDKDDHRDYFHTALVELGEGGIIKPSDTWFIETIDGALEWTDPEGYQFKVARQCLQQRHGHPSWSLITYSSDDTIVARTTYPISVKVQTPPKQYINIRANITDELGNLLHEPYKRANEIFQTAAKYIGKDNL